MVDSGDPRRRRRENDALVKFLAYVGEIEQALLRREALRVTALLRKRTATHLPREVREELLMLSRESRDSLRAPVQFLRFQHRMMQLAAGGEALPTAQTEFALEPRVATGAIRRRGAGDRRAAASDPIDAAKDPSTNSGDESAKDSAGNSTDDSSGDAAS